MGNACAKLAEDAEFTGLRQLLFDESELMLDGFFCIVALFHSCIALLKNSYAAVQIIFIFQQVELFHLDDIGMEMRNRVDGAMPFIEVFRAVAAHQTY